MQKNFQPLLATLFAILAILPSSARDSIKVFLLAGQSNMVGYGRIETGVGDRNGTIGSLRYQVDQDPDRYRHLVDDDGSWKVRDDVWVWSRQSEFIYQPPGSRDRFATGNLTAGFGHDAHAARSALGPELGFGHVLGDFYDEQVVLVKAAWGAATLAVHFRSPTAVTNRGGSVGAYYRLMLGAFEDALTDIATEFPGENIEIAGFGWHQGWSDRINRSFNEEYEENLTDFIVDVRNDLGVPNLPFVIAETGHGGPNETNPLALALMAAQKSMVDSGKYPEFSGNVGFVDTQRFWRDATVSPRNVNFHWNENGETYYLIGEAMGRAMTDLLPIKANPETLTVYQNFDPTISNRSDLLGPAGGAGECWNQSMSGEHNVAGGFWGNTLIDSTNNPTSIGWSLKRSDDAALFNWLASEVATLSLLDHGIVSPSALVHTLTVTGLDPAKKYDLYLMGYGGTTDPWTSESAFDNRLLLSTTNPTTTSSPQQMFQTGETADWIVNDNYVVFEDMIPHATGVLLINSVKESDFSFWSGFQLVECPTPGSPEITSIRSVGGDVWELTLTGAASTTYEFHSSPELTFETGSVVTSLVQENPEDDPGEVSDSTLLTTDNTGWGTVRMNLGGNATGFVRAQIPSR